MKPSEIEHLLKNSPDPELAFKQWDKIQNHFTPLFKKAGDYRSVMSLLGRSIFLVEFLLNNPQCIQELATSKYLDQKKTKTIHLEENQNLLQSHDLTSAKKHLRYFKYREMARILIRDFSGKLPFEEMGQELSCLASAAVEMAHQLHFKMNPWSFKEPCIFTTLGMGKLGGNDLNLSSDIDIIYLFDVPENLVETAPMGDMFETFNKAAKGVSHLLEDRTEDGIVFRVDLELRPQGKSGPLVNSLDSIMTYYEVAGASWERSALIKALPIAGDIALGQNFLKRILPFVYRRSIDPSIIGDLKKMKEKINVELGKNFKTYNLKLGNGGIREIEFFVSSFQLVYGGREILLRERNTLKVLKVLKELKLIPTSDAEKLHEAYVFLRRLENYIQSREERQTHCLPAEDKELLVMAKMMNCSSTDALTSRLTQHTQFVSECFNNLVA